MHVFSDFLTFGQIVCPVHNSESKFSMRDAFLEKRFKTSITKTTAVSVCLSLVPRFPNDCPTFSSVDVLLSRETWLPDAIQLHDPAGTTLNVFTIQKRRINDCAESVEHLFHPDLTNYRMNEHRDITTLYPIRLGR